MTPTGTAPGALIQAEIRSQPDSWEELIPLVLNQATELRACFEGMDHILLAGCGSGLNAARFAAPYIQTNLRLAAQSIPAADVAIYPDAFLPKRTTSRTVAVLLSRSGKTTETVNAMRRLREHSVPILGITCVPESPLAKEAQLSLVLEPVQEQAVATTRSLTGMILTIQLLTAILAKDDGALTQLRRLPSVGRKKLPDFEKIGKRTGERDDVSKYAFVANGPLIGLAHEGQLKFKETTMLPADAYPMLDFRHGPQSAADSSLLLTALLTASGQALEAEFLQDMRGRGVSIWAIGDDVGEQARGAAHVVTSCDAGMQEFLCAPLYMIPIQFAACHRSLQLGLNPDEPPGLPYWIEIEA
jgi:glucosamine--fructose-6-phosphate aminotransferase (isomerizing)